ncbi:energy-coupling factor transporter ATP-binding protein EcfA1 [Pullulanibacillus camelliae]|uniref:Energy-coupling factor transporter ATP-binding protein EcfA1 n=1 Tax=Pullulanibacillus camelliae TaxID=1707096 RepID=A0A8J2YNK3_9BACL|nr:energy-coupling factor ABC transporter ATP-binding protein [Pullulanibacillus camelliae]GGE54597.1 energy-coupling factor transporter ATP-binding protein EcfA1 [Pullulanibacillus camelliae]
MDKETIITIDNVWFRYADDAEDWALQDIHLDVYSGEWLAITGHNGSGKSTLAKCLNGLLMPEKGEIKVRDNAITDANALWEIRRLVGMVFQNPDNQFVGTTVRDDVAFGMENHGIERGDMLKRLEASLKAVDMQEFAEREPHRLSGGQKQRVAIAGIIALEPAIVILDEATSMLDPRGKKDVLDVMRRLNEEKGITVISITHDLEEASSADRMVVMDRGKVVREGQPSHIFMEPEGLVELGLDLPFTVKLRQALKEHGHIQLSDKAFTQKELVDELWTLSSKI